MSDEEDDGVWRDVASDYGEKEPAVFIEPTIDEEISRNLAIIEEERLADARSSNKKKWIIRHKRLSSILLIIVFACFAVYLDSMNNNILKGYVTKTFASQSSNGKGIWIEKTYKVLAGIDSTIKNGIQKNEKEEGESYAVLLSYLACFPSTFYSKSQCFVFADALGESEQRLQQKDVFEVDVNAEVVEDPIYPGELDVPNVEEDIPNADSALPTDSSISSKSNEVTIEESIEAKVLQSFEDNTVKNVAEALDVPEVSIVSRGNNENEVIINLEADANEVESELAADHLKGEPATDALREAAAVDETTKELTADELTEQEEGDKLKQAVADELKLEVSPAQSEVTNSGDLTLNDQDRIDRILANGDKILLTDPIKPSELVIEILMIYPYFQKWYEENTTQSIFLFFLFVGIAMVGMYILGNLAHYASTSMDLEGVVNAEALRMLRLNTENESDGITSTEISPASSFHSSEGVTLADINRSRTNNDDMEESTEDGLVYNGNLVRAADTIGTLRKAKTPQISRPKKTYYTDSSAKPVASTRTLRSMRKRAIRSTSETESNADFVFY